MGNITEQIFVEMFYIFIRGDNSVGLWDQEYTVGTNFVFEDQDDLDDFKEYLKDGFSLFGENPEVSTQEEIDAENLKFDMLDKISDEAGFVDDSMTDEEFKEAIRKDTSK